MFGVSPDTAPETATSELPAPGGGEHDTLLPYDSVGPYSSLHSVTSEPSGFTVALSVALVDSTPVAASVFTFGAAVRLLRRF